MKGTVAQHLFLVTIAPLVHVVYHLYILSLLMTRLFCHLDDHCLTLSKENFEKFQEMVSNIVTVARMRLLSPLSKACLLSFPFLSFDLSCTSTLH